jgi:hypothetical protein
MTQIETKVREAIASCRESLSAMAEKAQAYIDAHDRYLETTVKDSDFIKARIREGIERVYDNEG